MPDLPSGTVTFLFTDIEGSTSLWERDRKAMATAVARQLAILHGLIDAHHGVLYKTIGDGTQAAFASAEDAVGAAVAAQRALLQETWGDPPGPLRVRMALHAGDAEPDPRGDYLATPLNRLAQLLAVGHGGQILLTQAAQQLTRGALPAGVELRDLGEHRLRDLLEPERVFQLLHPELPNQFSPLQSLETRPTNLPRQPTPFLGREREVGEIAALLQSDDVQLLTLTGAGGTGKTRLALQAAAGLLDEFADGVIFVPLAALADPGLVPTVIATAVGVREEGGQPLLDRLAAHLASKHLLLVIDNWEHLLDGAAVLSELLRAAPGLTVLATSRAPLHLQAEREYPVPPLALPRRKPPPTLEQLSQYEAVRLFIARAQAVKPDFAIDNESAPAVAEICHRLDGLPLAIELAAAHVRMFPPQAMLTRLEKRLPLLTGGARDAPERQQTLRATIAWSLDLLSADEQTLFCRLAAFAGGATFDAVEAVANVEGGFDVFSALERLLEHNLLRQDVRNFGEPRFQMLETVREYGQEQLEASGEAEDIRQRQAAWCLALAEMAGPDLATGQRYNEWLSRLDDELPNIRAVIRWLLKTGAAALAVRIISVTHEYWGYRWHHEEVRQWLNAALAAAPDVPAIDRALAHFILVMTESMLGNHGGATNHAQRSLSAATESGDSFALGMSLYSRGLAREFSGDGEGAAVAYAEAVLHLRQSGNTFFTAWVLADLGDKLVWTGDIAGAVTAIDEALLLNEQAGFDTSLAMALGQRGYAALAQHDYTRAARVFRESIEVARRLADMRIALGAVAGIAGVAEALGQPELTARLLGAIAAAQEAAALDRIAHALHADRIASRTKIALGEAAFERERTAGRALVVEEAMVEALAFVKSIGARVALLSE